MNDTFGILAVNDLIILWIEKFQFLTKTLQSLFLVFLLHHLTRLLFDGRNNVYPFTDSIDIHHGPTC